MSQVSTYIHILNIIEDHISVVIEELKEVGRPISCKKGCAHCCSMLVEVTWDEAEVLVRWVMDQPAASKRRLIQRINKAAKVRQEFFQRKKSTQKYVKPTRSSMEWSDRLCKEYFREDPRPCPFLKNKACILYNSRPSACRLHMVSSPSDMCKPDYVDEGFEIPDEIDSLREDVCENVVPDSADERWGELSIMVAAVLRDYAS